MENSLAKYEKILPGVKGSTDYYKTFGRRLGTDRLGAFRDHGSATAWANAGDISARAGVYNPIEPTFYGSMALPERWDLTVPERSFNSPFGKIEFGPSDTPSSFYAELTPNKNNYYMQVLADMLMRTNSGKF